jgi:hypothetical protein
MRACKYIKHMRIFYLRKTKTFVKIQFFKTFISYFILYLKNLQQVVNIYQKHINKMYAIL